MAPRYIVLLVAGLLVLGAGAAFGIATLAGEGGDEAASDGAGVERAGDSSAPLDPSTIEVAVLNGTSISGAAESVSDSVEQAGFQIGNVANATEQTSAESAVLFAEGARSAAGEVGRELGISQLEPVDTDIQDLAGTADVVVVVGADQAE
ncbi:MAG: LytR C-terminal domain-containing protein [Thermoleophilaceae bacterium]|nr:LytR C-terminal domain-containing protein [Thermoleophilaceae bacterium]